jgi:hypothetical protein
LSRIRVTSVPEDAELTLDGSRVPNPFDTGMPRGGKHRIHAQAAGYHSKDLTLNFDRDQEVAIRLDRRETKPTRVVAPAKTLAVTRPRRPPPPAAPPRATFPPYRRPAPPATKGAGFVTESPY